MQISATILPLTLVLLQICGVSAGRESTIDFWRSRVQSAKKKFGPPPTYECEICLYYQLNTDPKVGCKTGQLKDVVTLNGLHDVAVTPRNGRTGKAPVAETERLYFKVKILENCAWNIQKSNSRHHFYYIGSRKLPLSAPDNQNTT